MKIRKSLFLSFDVESMILELNFPSALSKPSRILKTYLLLDQLVQEANDDQIIEFLSYINSNNGSCVPISYGLFHDRIEVRMAAARIILRAFIQKVIIFIV